MQQPITVGNGNCWLWLKQSRARACRPSGLQSFRHRNGDHATLRNVPQRCIIYTITSNDSNIQGVIKEIGDGGMVIEKSAGEREIINLDYVTRIREYPRTKRGRKKGVVLD